MATILNLKIVGSQKMHCTGCECTVSFTLSQLPGVQNVRADHKTQTVVLELAATETGIEQIKAELDWIGYGVEVL